MHISYDIKKGVKYARATTSVRKAGKVRTGETIYLGKVIDQQQGIYQNRNHGLCTFDLETKKFGKVPDEYLAAHPLVVRKPKLTVDFGDTFFLDRYVEKKGLSPTLEAIGCNQDTLRSMLSYYLLCGMANCHAKDWWEGNYASVLYPGAGMESQRISEFLEAIGEEENQRRMFAAYFALVQRKAGKKGVKILVDSTGLPNSIHFPLTAISNHNGDINNEARLIYVTHQKTGLPIFFRYIPGNIIDVTTLIRTIKELKAKGIETNYALFDAGYFSHPNIEALFNEKVSFVTRLKSNDGLYEELVAKHFGSLIRPENLVKYNGRMVYMKAVRCEIVKGRMGYAYVCLDVMRNKTEGLKYMRKLEDKDFDQGKAHNMLQNEGLFILVSSRKIKNENILPLYYTRQQVEQVFDIAKNYTPLLPLRVEKEETFRGHLVLTFLATIIIKLLQTDLEKTNYAPADAFLNLRNLKCQVYEDKVITMEPTKKVSDLFKLAKINCPIEIPRNAPSQLTA